MNASTGRGKLRVLLGAAPGVGKTYAMLDEGRSLKEEGKDVVVAIVETHGRAATQAMTEGLEILPRRQIDHRGVALTEMDVDAVLARHPEVVLVDELAHTNAPGSRHEKRWEDVEELREAGIDVISTVNIQHIESLNDVVQEITGVVQRETIPDEVLRAADQVEVVDLAPQALRERLSAGYVYSAERIDAALSNYFRLGNLTALRELALLWVADEVDSALKLYRTEHGIADTWEARERVVVALTGGTEGETLLRRGARIAARSGGGELMAVHVVSQDGLRGPNPANLSAQRILVEHLGGTYHQVVDDDIPNALVTFAKSVNATQLVLGATRRPWRFGPDINSTVIRESGSIDVHIVTTDASTKRFRLPRLTSGLTVRRRLMGFALALLGGPLLTWLMYSLRAEEITPDRLALDVLAFQVFAVIVAVVGGIWPALVAAIMSGLLLNYFFISPLNTLTLGEPSGFLVIAMYIIVAAVVSFIVDRAARQTRATRRTAAESEVLLAVAGNILRGQDAVQAILDRIREAFSLDAVRLTRDDTQLAESVDPTRGAPPRDSSAHFQVGERARLDVAGPDLSAAERRVMSVLLTQLDAALEVGDLTRTASEIEPLAASDRVRTALLAALSHDLRRPLTAATTAMGALNTNGLSPDDQARVARVDHCLATLRQLVDDLLDVSRLQAGVLVVTPTPVVPGDVIRLALEELDLGADKVELDLGTEVPRAMADAAFLQRVLVNLLLNAVRYAPEGTKVRVTTSAFAQEVEIRVIDHGPGITPEFFDQMFLPFRRHEDGSPVMSGNSPADADDVTGVGLGLALSKGFVDGMGGTLTPEDTPGGGLTMVVSLHADPEGTLG